MLNYCTSITYQVLLPSYFDNLLGLKKGNNGKWAWTSDGSGLEYSNWHPGEPNGNGNCARIHETTRTDIGRWDDISCTTKYHFVCQKS